MRLYHGTNHTISDGLATGTFFSDDKKLALFYATRKGGRNIYSIEIESPLEDKFARDMFGEHFISRCFIPLKYLTLTPIRPHDLENEVNGSRKEFPLFDV